MGKSRQDFGFQNQEWTCLEYLLACMETLQYVIGNVEQVIFQFNTQNDLFYLEAIYLVDRLCLHGGLGAATGGEVNVANVLGEEELIHGHGVHGGKVPLDLRIVRKVLVREAVK